MEIRVKEYLGNTLNNEDAIILRGLINNNLGSEIELDFAGIDRVPTTFLSCLFNDLIYRNGREAVIEQINVKNLSNRSDYSRVVRGTTFYQ
ncbi:MAG: STAS-like domain-containing protein [Sarcina sp.]